MTPTEDDVLLAIVSPRWECGYRCHGYWIELVRWGFIGIQGHSHGRLPKSDGYKWEFTPKGSIGNPPDPDKHGSCHTLKHAKLLIEKAYLDWVDHNYPVITSPSGVEYRNVPGELGYRVGSDGSVWTRIAIFAVDNSVSPGAKWRRMKTKIENHEANERH